MKNKIKRIPLHPVLAAIFPIVSLIANNLIEMSPNEGMRAIWISLLFTMASWSVLWFMVRHVEKAAAITTVGVILFFSYGHIHESFPFPLTVFGTPIRNHRFLFPFSLLLFFLITWLILKYLKNTAEITRVLNLMTVVAVIFPIFQISTSIVRELQNNEVNIEAAISGDPTVQRDVYLFVLDMYPREDFLIEEMGIDNSGFIQDLEDIGFYVAHCSQSNYQRTRMSLTTTLNMIYFEDYVEDLDFSDGEYRLRDLISHSEVRGIFEQMGYEIVAFETDYGWSEWGDADHYYSVNWDETNSFIDEMAEDQVLQSPLSSYLVKVGVNDFEWLLLKTTGFSFVLDMGMPDAQTSQEETDSLITKLRRFRLTRFVFDALLNDVPMLPGPKFVFTHIIMPHPPFVFTAEGDFLIDELPEPEAIAESIYYLDDRLILIVENIINQSEIEPIIILMGDHGYPVPGSAKRSTEILNAYYLPDSEANLLYSDISPINTFRLILTEYFGAEYPLLEDKSFYSPVGEAYSFYEVDNSLSSCDK